MDTDKYNLLMGFVGQWLFFHGRGWSMEAFSILVGIRGLKIKVVLFYKWLKLLLLFYFFNISKTVLRALVTDSLKESVSLHLGKKSEKTTKTSHSRSPTFNLVH
jgi:hypothetical protein